MTSKPTLMGSLASSKRQIAWYLSLGNHPNFSQQSLAPISTARRLATITPDYPHIWSTALARSNEDQASDLRSQATKPAEIPIKRRSPASKLGFIYIAGRSFSTISPTGSTTTTSGPLAPRQNGLLRKETILPGATLNRHWTTAPASGEGPFQPDERIDTMISAYTSRKTLSGAPAAPPPRDLQMMQAGLSVAPQRRSPLSKEADSDEKAALTAADQPSQGTSTANNDVLSPVQYTGALTAGDAIGQASPNTLHLDGAVLGRWTIQHLERALSKPSNGMTGVDPRATTPRGHISPF